MLRIDRCQAEIDISVLKLLGFDTFDNVLRVSVSVLENLVLEKSSGFGNFGLKKVLVFWFWKTWSRKKKSKQQERM